MSGIGLLQPDVCEVQLARDHVQPHQHVQGDHPDVNNRKSGSTNANPTPNTKDKHASFFHVFLTFFC